MRISFVIIIVMFSMSLVFTVFGLVTFDLSVNEIKKLLAVRNENFAYNMIQGLDKHIEERVIDFEDLTKLELIHNKLTESNLEFERIQDITEYLNIKEQEIEYTKVTPFVGQSVSDEILISELQDTIDFYHDEYNYDVVEELFVTNAYGANVAIVSGTSDYLQSDEEWWQITKDVGKYVGKIQYNDEYESYSIDFGYRIDDAQGNFLGVLRVVITMDDFLNEYVEESDLLTTSGRNAILLDENGHLIFSNGQITTSDASVSYFSDIAQGEDTGYLELDDKTDDFLLISYAKSTGYRTFEGFDWVSVVEQNSSSIVQEFVELRNSILTVSVLGMIVSVVVGVLISKVISSPLRRLTETSRRIAKGNFDVDIKKSRINEINIIGNSLKEMSGDLQNLIDTEKKLAEAHVKIKNERMTAMGELSASMAHNMKNPLGIIQSSAHILQKNTMDKEMDDVVKRMNRAIDRMSHQINDVLNYVRTTPLEKNTIKITDLLNSAKNTLEIPEHITISVPDSSIEISCDVRKMEIVFTNIFLNAIQAIGTEQGKVICKIDQNKTSAIIEIQDSGPGIPKNLMSQIFNPLVTSKQKGTGLGLSTCKNVIEQHGGTIAVQNNPTRFTITIPLSQS
ncbi:sensor histidine kinase [Nitrosopumilus zosterae]|uniref:sensor histidine kinase n=1 Tax=Nitrosopumilus zosterae TaxID=718286 RepID=UPI001CECF5C3|nr:sensor histidine kinase [Nitrosopumilus zosterae]BDQ30356.1 sensor histidine kinase [Nitrosopumilus zosterae]